MSLSFSLPAGTRALPSPAQDGLTDNAITALLLNPPSEVTSQKNIWAFWDKGFGKLYGWQKRNVIGWVRKLGPEGWTVRVLDSVPGSPTNILRYLDPSTLPSPVTSGAMTGTHSGQHLSDLVRLPLLHRYGGIYLDVGVLLLGDLESSLWKPITDPTTDFRIGGFAHHHRANSWGSLQNFCLVAQKGEDVLLRWQRIMLAVWDGRISSTGLAQHPVFEGVPAEPNPRVLMTIKPGSEALLQDYWVNLLAWEKLKVTVDATSGWNGPEFVRRHVLFLDPLQEAFAAEVRTRLNTPRLFQMLTCPRDVSEKTDPSLQREAQALVEYLLVNSTVVKLYHGHGYMLAPPLATFWEAPENGGNADVRPGSFGEYLRYAGEIIDQQRKVTPLQLGLYEGPVLHSSLP